jgi:pyrroloquinoline quinone biosynthesis protein B
LIIKVLGSAAGGGFPQANCNCRNCSDVRQGKPGLRARTQSSIAVSADGLSWVLLNASPDLRQQIAATPELAPRPRDPARTSPIKAVVLTNGDVDHVAGLLSLREGFRFDLFASRRVLGALQDNRIFDVLDPACVKRLPLAPGAMVAPTGIELRIESFAVPGKVALYLEQLTSGDNFGTRDGDTIGLRITDPSSGAAAFYIPGCATVNAALAARLRGARLVLFDGTLYTDDEMITLGLSAKSGRRMGHMAMSGADGSLAAFRDLGVGQRIYVHLNNSNPVLREDSPERAEVERAGWSVAWDGMEIRL